MCHETLLEWLFFVVEFSLSGLVSFCFEKREGGREKKITCFLFFRQRLGHFNAEFDVQVAKL
jgi:hypothetical protein